jgi:TolB-like protein
VNLPGPDIFISYNRDDAAVAKVFADAFARDGLEVWWDQTLRSGETYDEVTEAALRSAKAVVVLWSPRSVSSHWVRAEATIAHRAKTLVPATIEACDKPVMFELTQTAELSHWRGDERDPTWLSFLADVSRKAGRREAIAAPDPAPPSGSIGKGKPSKVAVLPIIHRGDDGELEQLAEDLTEEITRELAQNSWFEVIASGRMAAWRGKAADYEAVGRQLDARYLIESKIQRGGDTVRLTLQIVDVGSGGLLRSLRISHNSVEMISASDEVSASTAVEIGEQVVQAEENRAMAKQGQLCGWERLFRALAFIRRRDNESFTAAIAELRQAIADAPELGLAHALLAHYLTVTILGKGEQSDNDLLRSIQYHARQAVLLDGENPTVISYLVSSYNLLGDVETGHRLARRVVASHPRSPGSHFALGSSYLAIGQTAEALAAFTEYDRLTQSDSMRPVGLVCLGMACWYEGMAAEAEAAIDRALAIHPEFELGLRWKAIIAGQRGDERTAQAALKRLRASEPAMTLEKHVRQIREHSGLGDRSADLVETLRRLWDATEGEARAG